MHQFQSLRYHLNIRLGHASNVATRSVQALHEALVEWGRRPVSKTSGIVVVAAFAAIAAGVLVAAITAT